MYSLIEDINNGWQMTKNGKNIPPGLMQYKIKKKDIISMIPNQNYNNNGWTFVSHSKENLQKLIPDTKTGKEAKWKLLLVIRRVGKDVKNSECLKGALLNKNTKEIALMSSLNKIAADNYEYRLVKSLHKDYKICQSKMIAPLIFWDELKNRLLY